MIDEKKRVPMLVLMPCSIETRGRWSLAQKENLFQCMDCKGSLFYVRLQWGVVEEEFDYNVLGYRSKKYLVMRELGLALYCGICGQFQDDYSSWAYPEDKIVCTWDDEDLEYAELEELKLALDVYNHTGKVKGWFESSEIRHLRKKVEEYEQKNKISIKKGKHKKQGK